VLCPGTRAEEEKNIDQLVIGHDATYLACQRGMLGTPLCEGRSSMCNLKGLRGGIGGLQHLAGGISVIRNRWGPFVIHVAGVGVGEGVGSCMVGLRGLCVVMLVAMFIG